MDVAGGCRARGLARVDIHGALRDHSLVRRTLTAVGITLAMLAAIAVVAWFVWVPHYRPPLEQGEFYGIDVSHHQGEIDWSAVAADDITFAFIKATEGGDWVDPRFHENWAGARDSGLSVGAYHFFRTCTDAELQAENILATIPDVPSLEIAIDVEGGGLCGEGVTDTDIRRKLEALIELVEAERGPVIFYVLEGFDEFDDIFDQRERWQRGLGFRPAEDDWYIWQQSNQASINGIDGPVDLNVGRIGLIFEF